MTPLERAARAAQIAYHGWDPETRSDSWGQWLPAVRAAFLAIREPSAAMIDAGDDTETEYQSGLTDLKSEKVWPAMIDAALEEG